MHPILKKTVSIIVLVAFLPSGIAYSAPAISTPALSEIPAPAGMMIQIPEKWGKTEMVVPGSGPSVVHLQTAHGNYEAQKNIQKILHQLKNQYGFKTVFVEGSPFDLRPEALRFFPKDPSLSMKANDLLARRAIVKGADLFLVEEKEAKGIGVEDLGLYKANGLALREVIREREKTGGFIEQINLQAEQLGSLIFSPELRSFQKEAESWEAGTLLTEEWLSKLKKTALQKLRLDFSDASSQIEWPMLARYYKAEEFGKALDAAKLEKEKEHFLKRIRHLPAAETLRKILQKDLPAALPAEEFEKLLENLTRSLPRGFNYTVYPNLNRYLGQRLLLSELNGREFHSEITLLQEKIALRLAVSPKEEKLWEILKSYRLLQKLFRLELTPDEYEKILDLLKTGGGKDILPEKITDQLLEMNGEARLRAVSFEHLADIQSLFEKALSFYDYARRRDDAMLDNMLQRMKKDGISKAVVVTGGFHAEPFQARLESLGMNYALITPRLSLSSENSEREAYLGAVFQENGSFTRSTYETPEAALPWNQILQFHPNPEWLKRRVKAARASVSMTKQKSAPATRAELRTETGAANVTDNPNGIFELMGHGKLSTINPVVTNQAVSSFAVVSSRKKTVDVEEQRMNNFWQQAQEFHRRYKMFPVHGNLVLDRLTHKAVLLVGDPGVGKSLTTFEMTRLLGSRFSFIADDLLISYFDVSGKWYAGPSLYADAKHRTMSGGRRDLQTYAMKDQAQNQFFEIEAIVHVRLSPRETVIANLENPGDFLINTMTQRSMAYRVPEKDAERILALKPITVRLVIPEDKANRDYAAAAAAVEEQLAYTTLFRQPREEFRSVKLIHEGRSADRHFTREIELIEGAKDQLFDQLTLAFQKGVFYGNTRLFLAETLLGEQIRAAFFDVNFSTGQLVITPTEGAVRAYSLFLDGHPVTAGTLLADVIPHVRLQVLFKTLASQVMSLPILEFISENIRVSPLFRYDGKANFFRPENLEIPLNMGEMLGEIRRERGAVESVILQPRLRTAKLHIQQLREGGYGAIMEYVMSFIPDPPDEYLRWHTHAYNSAQPSLKDLESWQEEKAEVIITKRQEGEYLLNLFRPRSPESVKQALAAFRTLIAVLGPAAIFNDSIVPEHFHIKQIVLTRAELRREDEFSRFDEVEQAEMNTRVAARKFEPSGPRHEMRISVLDLVFAGVWGSMITAVIIGYRLMRDKREKKNQRVGFYRIYFPETMMELPGRISEALAESSLSKYKLFEILWDQIPEDKLEEMETLLDSGRSFGIELEEGEGPIVVLESGPYLKALKAAATSEEFSQTANDSKLYRKLTFEIIPRFEMRQSRAEFRASELEEGELDRVFVRAFSKLDLEEHDDRVLFTRFAKELIDLVRQEQETFLDFSRIRFSVFDPSEPSVEFTGPQSAEDIFDELMEMPITTMPSHAYLYFRDVFFGLMDQDSGELANAELVRFFRKNLTGPGKVIELDAESQTLRLKHEALPLEQLPGFPSPEDVQRIMDKINLQQLALAPGLGFMDLALNLLVEETLPKVFDVLEELAAENELTGSVRIDPPAVAEKMGIGLFGAVFGDIVEKALRRFNDAPDFQFLLHPAPEKSVYRISRRPEVRTNSAIPMVYRLKHTEHPAAKIAKSLTDGVGFFWNYKGQHPRAYVVLSPLHLREDLTRFITRVVLHIYPVTSDLGDAVEAFSFKPELPGVPLQFSLGKINLEVVNWGEQDLLLLRTIQSSAGLARLSKEERSKWGGWKTAAMEALTRQAKAAGMKGLLVPHYHHVRAMYPDKTGGKFGSMTDSNLYEHYIRHFRGRQGWRVLSYGNHPQEKYWYLPFDEETALESSVYTRPELRTFHNTMRRYDPYKEVAAETGLALDSLMGRIQNFAEGKELPARNAMVLSEHVESGGQQMNLTAIHNPETQVRYLAVRAHAAVNPDQIFFVEIEDDVQPALAAVRQFLAEAYLYHTFDFELGVGAFPSGYHDVLLITVHAGEEGQVPVISPIPQGQRIFSLRPVPGESLSNQIRGTGPAGNRPSFMHKFRRLGRSELRTETSMDQKAQALVRSGRIFTEEDSFLFSGTGNHYRLFEKLGAHPIRIAGETVGTYFAVWAPNAKIVSVAGDFNGWNPDANPMMRIENTGVWAAAVSGAHEGQHYKYVIDGPDGGYLEEVWRRNRREYFYELQKWRQRWGVRWKADPFAFFSQYPTAEEKERTASIITDLYHDWNDGSWMQGRADRHGDNRPISIYEMHLGTWQVHDDGTPLSYRELAPRLADYVKQMEFTHVEFLPWTEHYFGGSGGYQVANYFAPTSRYGTPQDLMFLIDTLHQNDIGVIMDWVPAHFPQDPVGLNLFDGTHLFDHEDPRQGQHPHWGTRIFNYGRHEVKSFLISSAYFWARRYHVDGFRVDGVSSMLYRDFGREPGQWVPNEFGDHESLEATELLQDMNYFLQQQFPGILTIAEESTSWPGVSRPWGLGFGRQQALGWMNDTFKEFLKLYPYKRLTSQAYAKAFQYTTFMGNGRYVLPLSHDEVTNGQGSLLMQLPGSYYDKLANLRLLYAHMYTMPGNKLLFMGNELAPFQEWNSWTPLRWDLLEQEAASRGMQAYVRDLNTLYRVAPPLHELDFSPKGFEWMHKDDPEQGVFSFLRKGEKTEDQILVVFNMSGKLYPEYRVGVPAGGNWFEIFNSGAPEYMGRPGTGLPLSFTMAENIWMHGRPHSLNLSLPRLSVKMFTRNPEIAQSIRRAEIRKGNQVIFALSVLGWAGWIATAVLTAIFMQGIFVKYLSAMFEGWFMIGWTFFVSRYQGQYWKQIGLMAAGVGLVAVGFHVVLPLLVPGWTLPSNVSFLKILSDIAVRFISTFAGVYGGQRARGAISEKEIKTALKWGLSSGVGFGYYVYFVFFSFLSNPEIIGMMAQTPIPFIDSSPEASLIFWRIVFDLGAANVLVHTWLLTALGVVFGENQNILKDMKQFPRKAFWQSTPMRTVLFFYPLNFLIWVAALGVLWWAFPAGGVGFQAMHAVFSALSIGFLQQAGVYFSALFAGRLTEEQADTMRRDAQYEGVKITIRKPAEGDGFEEGDVVQIEGPEVKAVAAEKMIIRTHALYDRLMMDPYIEEAGAVRITLYYKRSEIRTAEENNDRRHILKFEPRTAAEITALRLEGTNEFKPKGLPVEWTKFSYDARHAGGGAFWAGVKPLESGQRLHQYLGYANPLDSEYQELMDALTNSLEVFRRWQQRKSLIQIIRQVAFVEASVREDFQAVLARAHDGSVLGVAFTRHGQTAQTPLNYSDLQLFVANNRIELFDSQARRTPSMPSPLFVRYFPAEKIWGWVSPLESNLDRLDEIATLREGVEKNALGLEGLSRWEVFPSAQPLAPEEMKALDAWIEDFSQNFKHTKQAKIFMLSRAFLLAFHEGEFLNDLPLWPYFLRAVRELASVIKDPKIFSEADLETYRQRFPKVTFTLEAPRAGENTGQPVVEISGPSRFAAIAAAAVTHDFQSYVSYRKPQEDALTMTFRLSVPRSELRSTKEKTVNIHADGVRYRTVVGLVAGRVFELKQTLHRSASYSRIRKIKAIIPEKMRHALEGKTIDLAVFGHASDPQKIYGLQAGKFPVTVPEGEGDFEIDITDLVMGFEAAVHYLRINTAPENHSALEQLDNVEIVEVREVPHESVENPLELLRNGRGLEHYMQQVYVDVEDRQKGFPFQPMARVGAAFFDGEGRKIAHAINHFGQNHAERLVILNAFQARLNEMKQTGTAPENAADIQLVLDYVRMSLRTEAAFTVKSLDYIKWLREALGDPLHDLVLFINLEPCIRCADVVIAAGIRYVVYGAPDRNPVPGTITHGKLNPHGIQVVGGVLEEKTARQYALVQWFLDYTPTLYYSVFRELHRKIYSAFQRWKHRDYMPELELRLFRSHLLDIDSETGKPIVVSKPSESRAELREILVTREEAEKITEVVGNVFDHLEEMMERPPLEDTPAARHIQDGVGNALSWILLSFGFEDADDETGKPAETQKMMPAQSLKFAIDLTIRDMVVANDILTSMLRESPDTFRLDWDPTEDGKHAGIRKELAELVRNRTERQRIHDDPDDIQQLQVFFEETRRALSDFKALKFPARPELREKKIKGPALDLKNDFSPLSAFDDFTEPAHYEIFKSAFAFSYQAGGFDALFDETWYSIPDTRKEAEKREQSEDFEYAAQLRFSEAMSLMKKAFSRSRRMPSKKMMTEIKTALEKSSQNYKRVADTGKAPRHLRPEDIDFNLNKWQVLADYAPHVVLILKNKWEKAQKDRIERLKLQKTDFGNTRFITLSMAIKRLKQEILEKMNWDVDIRIADNLQGVKRWRVPENLFEGYADYWKEMRPYSATLVLGAWENEKAFVSFGGESFYGLDTEAFSSYRPGYLFLNLAAIAKNKSVFPLRFSFYREASMIVNHARLRGLSQVYGRQWLDTEEFFDAMHRDLLPYVILQDMGRAKEARLYFKKRIHREMQLGHPENTAEQRAAMLANWQTVEFLAGTEGEDDSRLLKPYLLIHRYLYYAYRFNERDAFEAYFGVLRNKYPETSARVDELKKETLRVFALWDTIFKKKPEPFGYHLDDSHHGIRDQMTWRLGDFMRRIFEIYHEENGNFRVPRQELRELSLEEIDTEVSGFLNKIMPRAERLLIFMHLEHSQAVDEVQYLWKQLREGNFENRLKRKTAFQMGLLLRLVELLYGSSQIRVGEGIREQSEDELMEQIDAFSHLGYRPSPSSPALVTREDMIAAFTDQIQSIAADIRALLDEIGEFEQTHESWFNFSQQLENVAEPFVNGEIFNRPPGDVLWTESLLPAWVLWMRQDRLRLMNFGTSLHGIASFFEKLPQIREDYALDIHEIDALQTPEAVEAYMRDIPSAMVNEPRDMLSYYAQLKSAKPLKEAQYRRLLLKPFEYFYYFAAGKTVTQRFPPWMDFLDLSSFKTHVGLEPETTLRHSILSVYAAARLFHLLYLKENPVRQELRTGLTLRVAEHFLPAQSAETVRALIERLYKGSGSSSWSEDKWHERRPLFQVLYQLIEGSDANRAIAVEEFDRLFEAVSKWTRRQENVSRFAIVDFLARWVPDERVQGYLDRILPASGSRLHGLAGSAARFIRRQPEAGNRKVMEYVEQVTAAGFKENREDKDIARTLFEAVDEETRENIFRRIMQSLQQEAQAGEARKKFLYELAHEVTKILPANNEQDYEFEAELQWLVAQMLALPPRERNKEGYPETQNEIYTQQMELLWRLTERPGMKKYAVAFLDRILEIYSRPYGRLEEVYVERAVGFTMAHAPGHVLEEFEKIQRTFKIPLAGEFPDERQHENYHRLTLLAQGLTPDKAAQKFHELAEQLFQEKLYSDSIDIHLKSADQGLDDALPVDQDAARQELYSWHGRSNLSRFIRMKLMETLEILAEKTPELPLEDFNYIAMTSFRESNNDTDVSTKLDKLLLRAPLDPVQTAEFFDNMIQMMSGKMEIRPAAEYTGLGEERKTQDRIRVSAMMRLMISKMDWAAVKPLIPVVEALAAEPENYIPGDFIAVMKAFPLMAAVRSLEGAEVADDLGMKQTIQMYGDYQDVTIYIPNAQQEGSYEAIIAFHLRIIPGEIRTDWRIHESADPGIVKEFFEKVGEKLAEALPQIVSDASTQVIIDYPEWMKAMEAILKAKSAMEAGGEGAAASMTEVIAKLNMAAVTDFSNRKEVSLPALLSGEAGSILKLGHLPQEDRHELRAREDASAQSRWMNTVVKVYRGGILPLAYHLKVLKDGGIEALRRAVAEISGRQQAVKPLEPARSESYLQEKMGEGVPVLSGRLWDVSKETARMEDPGVSGHVLLDFNLLKKMASEDPRALFLLLSSADKRQRGMRLSGNPILATAVNGPQRKELAGLLKKSLTNRSAAKGAELESVAEVLHGLENGTLVHFINITKGTEIADYLEKQKGGVVVWHTSESAYSYGDATRFALGGTFHTEDWTYITAAALLTEPAAKLIRFLKDPAVRAERLRQYVAEHLPGFEPRAGEFVLSTMEKLVNDFHSRQIVETKA